MCVCVSVCVFSHSVMSNSLWPHGLQPTRFLYPWDFPGKNIGVGCHFLLQGNFSTQGSNLYLLCLLYCRQIFYHWATGSQQSGKFIKRWEYQTTLSASWEICTQVKKQQLKPDMEQQTGSKLWQGYAEYIMWNARLDDSQAGIKIDRRNINNVRCAGDTTLMAESKEETKEPLDEGERGKWKSLLKTQHLKN